MSPEQLDLMCAVAMWRLQQAINRGAAQQVRRMREGWAK